MGAIAPASADTPAAVAVAVSQPSPPPASPPPPTPVAASPPPRPPTQSSPLVGSSAARSLAAAVGDGSAVAASPPQLHTSHGTALPATGDRAVFDVDASRSRGGVQPQLQVAPITVVKTDYRLQVVHQIAVNSQYICYGLRGGHIRVLNKNTALRTLLKAEGGSGVSELGVVDMRFFSPSSNLLASCDQAGLVVVRKIFEESPEDRPEADPSTISQEVLVKHHMGPSSSPCTRRLAWHPQLESLLAVAAGGRVALVNVPPSAGVASSPEFSAPFFPTSPVASISGAAPALITSLTFNDRGDLLAASDDQGFIHVWALGPAALAGWRGDEGAGPPAPLPAEADVRFRAFEEGSREVASAIEFLPGRGGAKASEASVLVVGNSNCSLLRLWMVDIESAPQCTHTLELTSSGSKPDPNDKEGAFFNHLIVQPCFGAVVLANTKGKQVYVLHVKHYARGRGGGRGGGARFDFAADFAVTQPILSLTTTSERSFEDGAEVFYLFTVQTEGIQQYTLFPETCLPPRFGEEEEEDGEGTHAGILAQGEEGEVEGPMVPAPTVPLLSPAQVVEGGGDRLPLMSPAGRRAEQDIEGSSSVSKASSVTVTSVAVDRRHPASAASPAFGAGAAAARAAPPARRAAGGSTSSSDAVSPYRPLADEEEEEGTAPPPPVPCATPPPQISGHPLRDLSFNEGDNGGDGSVGSSRSASCSPPGARTPGGPAQQPVAHTPSVHPPPPPPSSLFQKLSGTFSGNQLAAASGVSGGGGGGGEEEPSSSTATSRPPHPPLPSFATAAALQAAVAAAAGASRERGAVVVDTAPAPTAAAPTASAPAASPGSIGGIGEAMLKGLGWQPGTGLGAQRQGIVEPIVPVKKKHLLGGLGFAKAAAPPSGGAGGGKGGKGAKEAGDGAAGAVPSSFSDASAVSPFIAGEGSESLQRCLSELASSQRDLAKQLRSELVAALASSKAPPPPPTAAATALTETQVARAVEGALKAQAKAWEQERAKEAKAQEAATKRALAELRKEIQEETAKALQQGLANAVRELSAVVRESSKASAAAVAAAVAGPVGRAIGEALPTALASGPGQQALERAIGNQLGVTLPRAVADVFATTVLPSVENASRAMFSQMEVAFKAGLAKHLEAAQAASAELGTSVRSSVAQAQAAAQQMTAAAAAASAHHHHQHGSSTPSGHPHPHHHHHRVPISLAELERPKDPKVVIAEHVAARRYEAAFTETLNTGSPDTTMWLCKQVSASAIFSIEPCPLSQGVLLSLMTHLAHDLTNSPDIELKLEWLLEAGPAINPKDPVIASHCKQVLEPIKAQLVVLARGGGAGGGASPGGGLAKKAVHLVNSLLHSG